ncbi:protein of unknown function [Xenorhabdus poinarii G6]|uniref:Uncharacterized protein n=1 Tax=Xenorhabdus poinarii G6 TaxID=1354304 RepID=A0A068QY05_9GAMM|nr:protein of unknown function [Xenorhabdus poinarii G6]
MKHDYLSSLNITIYYYLYMLLLIIARIIKYQVGFKEFLLYRVNIKYYYIFEMSNHTSPYF